MGKGVAVIYGRTKGESRHHNTALLLISAAFLAGGILGWMTEGKLPSSQYVQGFLEYIKQNSFTDGTWRECWSVFRWPILVILFSRLPMAGLAIPGLLCLRGFLLSYSIAAFMEEGVLHTLLLFGPTCVLTLPVLFLLSTEILLRKAGESVGMKPAVCLLALCLCIVIDLTVTPMLLK